MYLFYVTTLKDFASEMQAESVIFPVLAPIISSIFQINSSPITYPVQMVSNNLAIII